METWRELSSLQHRQSCRRFDRERSVPARRKAETTLCAYRDIVYTLYRAHREHFCGSSPRKIAVFEAALSLHFWDKVVKDEGRSRARFHWAAKRTLDGTASFYRIESQGKGVERAFRANLSKVYTMSPV
jgi:hypothetical protein